MATKSPSPSVPPGIVWSSEVRSLVSLLLFVHLFAVFVAVTTYTRPSGLQERLHQVFGPYLRTLHLTAFPVTYPFARYHLTHAMPTDVDFTCEVEFTGSDGPQTISIPQRPLWPRIRLRRYQALANATGALSDEEADEDLAGVLPRAIAGSVLKSHGVGEGTFRCRAHYLPLIEQMAEVDAGRRAPLENLRVTYEAQVIASGGNVELLKKSRTLEVAPIESQPQTPSGPGAPQGAPQ